MMDGHVGSWPKKQLQEPTYSEDEIPIRMLSLVLVG